LTLARIYKLEGDNSKAISALKASIRKHYTSDKEQELKDLGYELDDDDIEFNYPMEDDALGWEPFFDVIPKVPGAISESPQAYAEWSGFQEALDLLQEKLRREEDIAGKRVDMLIAKAKNPILYQPILKMHNNNPHNIAERKLIMAHLNRK